MSSSVSYNDYKMLKERFQVQKTRLVLHRDETDVPTIEQQNLDRQVLGAEDDFQQTARKMEELDRLLDELDGAHSNEQAQLEGQIKEMVNLIGPMFDNLNRKVQELEAIVINE